jgi:hypothetical protein
MLGLHRPSKGGVQKLATLAKPAEPFQYLGGRSFIVAAKRDPQGNLL